MKTKPQPLPFGAIFIALLFTVLITIFLYSGIHPWALKPISQISANLRTPSGFIDLNHDGFSEFMELSIGNKQKQNNNYIVFYNYDMAILDQCNTREYINPEQVFYGDYTGDGYDECFVFTAKQDSVFLYVFDILKQKVLLDRQFVINIPRIHHFFLVKKARLINRKGRKELLFALHPGRAPKPRGVYIFDLKKKTIVKRFENQSSKDTFLFFDLTGDGHKEIIVLGKANGNGPRHAPFTDYKNWVFFLDQNLKEIFPPLSYGAYPSKIIALPVQIHDKPYLLIANYRLGKEFIQKPLGIYLIDSRGHFTRRQFYNIKELTGLYMTPDNPDAPRQLYLTFSNKQLGRYDIYANTLTLKNTGLNKLQNILVHDLDMDGKGELLVNSENGLQVFDQDLNLLANTEIPDWSYISIRRRGFYLPPEIGVSGKDHFHQYRALKNPLIPLLPALFIGLFLFLSLLFIFTTRLINRIYIYFSYFVYSIKQTPNGVLILRPGGRIFHLNNRFRYLLKIDEPVVRNGAYHKIFAPYPEILQFIEEILHNKKAGQKELFIRRENAEIHGLISALPFNTRFGRTIAWLIEVQDFSKPVLSDRHKTWSRTVRKMAHDIKTPLGSVLLNVERIQQKIEDTLPGAAGITAHDFTMTISEIRRIQEMTRQFLKFTKIDAPDLQPVHFHKVLEDTLMLFSAYFNKELRFELNLEQEPCTVLGDMQQLQMALQIFIENSIDALRGKGKILISTVLAQNLEENFRNELEIEIADNGPGIRPENQGQIFEPFYTTKKDGTGMGLAIARKIIYDHKGTLELISKENYGAVFRITLPVYKENR